MNAEMEWPSILEFDTGTTITARLVEQRYRKLAKKYHPDAGGSDADMQQLNIAKNLALKWIATERKRQEQVAQYAIQVAGIQKQHKQIADAYAYQQQQFSDWANSMNSMNAGQCAQQANQGSQLDGRNYIEYMPTIPPSNFQKLYNWITQKGTGR